MFEFESLNDMSREPFYRKKIFNLANAIKDTYPEINFMIRPCHNGWQIRNLFDQESKVWDIICHAGSEGHEMGLFETYGEIVPKDYGDSVEGFLTTEDVLKRLKVLL